jgi:hypothetical protein
MQKLYDSFYKSCRLFEQFIQEQKWKKVKNKIEFKTLINNEFMFWKRVISMLPPERNLVKEFKWFAECYDQIHKNLDDAPINWKVRWLHDESDTLE